MTEGLAEAIDRLAGELDEVRRRTVGTAVEYDRGGMLFAVREPGRLSVRLREDIAAAALRTPDTAASDRGAEWVALAPAVADSFAIDRATSWFETAWRFAGGPAEAAGPAGPGPRLN
jgi:hypothetical protein